MMVMIRTQIQLTEQQMESLRATAERERISIAEVIRRAVDEVVARSGGPSRAELKQRAIDIAGRFASGVADVSTEHDRHLAEAFDRAAGAARP